MAKREFLQLADHYDPHRHDVAGWFISEKLDGQRCFWDGGLTRGLPTEQVPWASVTDPKTGQRKAKIKPVSTGLWSRYGNPIMAPDWWLNQLPCCPLDGELWSGRGKFQLCRSICGGDTPDERFDKIVFAVYSTPPLGAVFATGEIKNANMVCHVDYLTIEAWIRQRLNSRGSRFDGLPVPKRCLGDDFRFLTAEQTFGKELAVLNEALENTDNSVCYLHPQTKLIDIPGEAGRPGKGSGPAGQGDSHPGRRRVGGGVGPGPGGAGPREGGTDRSPQAGGSGEPGRRSRADSRPVVGGWRAIGRFGPRGCS